MSVRASVLIIGTILWTVSAGAAAQPNYSCKQVKYSDERTQLEKLMLALGYTLKERSFLIDGVSKRVNELQRSDLNASGLACGIKLVRTYVVGCLNHQLRIELKSASDLGGRTGKTFWNKANASRREVFVIAMFHTCRAVAMEIFTTFK